MDEKWMNMVCEEAFKLLKEAGISLQYMDFEDFVKQK